MTRIILHLGTHKTGSTTFQMTLHHHREALRALDVAWYGPGGPYPDLYSAFLTDPLSYVWNRHSGLDPAGIRQRDRSMLDRLSAQLKAETAGTVVVSSEYLSKLDATELAALRDFFAAHGEVHAIYVYRELLSWLSSDSQQLAKAGTRSRPTQVATALERIHAMPLRVRDVFGAEASTFVRFEDAVSGGLCDSLMACVGLPRLSDHGMSEIRANESISAEAVRALFLYNKLFPLGSPGRSQQRVRRLMDIPGPKYKVAGLKPKQIARYAALREEVQRELGLTLAAPEDIPVADALDPATNQLLRMVDDWAEQGGHG